MMIVRRVGLAVVYGLGAVFRGASAVSLRDASERLSEDEQVLLIVRTAKPKPGMLRRMATWQADIDEHPDLNVKLLVSIDTTTSDEVATIKKTVPRAMLHVYNWTSVTSSFPMPADAASKEYHTEPIILAFEYVRAQDPTIKPDFVWVLEDDVFFCGHLTTMLERHRWSRADFLARYDSGPKLFLEPRLFWHSARPCSDNFGERYPMPARRIEPEHMQRFSAKFIDHLTHLSRDLNVTAWSETFPPTVCSNDGFRCEGLRPDTVGEFLYDIRFTEASAKELCDKVPEFSVTVNHAGKF